MISYLDYNASTPIGSDVLEYMIYLYKEIIGNADSRTHSHGTMAKTIVENARKSIALLLNIDSSEVIFTSGATESSNIAILGLAEWGIKNGKTHIITTAIEHKSTLEPIRHLETKGFTAEYVFPDETGIVKTKDIISKITDKTLLVSVQHVNNETGIIQPIKEIGEFCSQKNVWYHIDAAQSCGKLVKELQSCKYDMLSATAHKMYGPQGVGMLITRKTNYKKPPLTPHSYGGGQENGFRPGTLPVALIGGLGKAAELALMHHEIWEKSNQRIKQEILTAIETSGVNYLINGDQKKCVSNTLNIAFTGVNSEALMIALRETCSLSNGSACTSKDYNPSYVLLAMGRTADIARSSVRLSWGKGTTDPQIKKIIESVKQIY